MKKKISLILIACSLGLGAMAQVTLRVMSYNIRLDVESDGENKWDLRKQRVTGLMKYHGADFIGGQEVQEHQRLYILSQLDGFSSIGVGRDDGKTGGEYSCIFYNTKKYKLVKQSTFWLSATPDTVSRGWDAACNRVCTYGLFMDKISRKLVWIFNTHFDHIGVEARRNAAKLILTRIASINKENYPLIFMGDLNTHPDEEPAHIISSKLTNVRTVAKEVYGNADTWNAFHFGEKPNGCIDYIFMSPNPNVKALSFATITDSYDMKYPSDHFPVLATFQLKTKDE